MHVDATFYLPQCFTSKSTDTWTTHFSVDPPIQHLPAAGVAFAAAPEYVVGRGDNPAVCSVEIRDVSSKALESV